MSEKTTPIRAAAEAMEDAAFRLTGRDLGTLYRDRIATETVTAALDAVDLEAVLARASAEFSADVTIPHYRRHQVATIRAALLEGSDR